MKPELYDLFNLFWQKVEMRDFKPQDGMVFFCLVHCSNRLNWANPFSLSNKRATLLAGISEKTLRECRARLQDRGLIRFNEGKRKAASPVYYLPVKDDNGNFYIPTEGKTERKTGGKTEGKTERKTGGKTGGINKTIDIKQKTENNTRVVDEPVLFSEEELVEKKSKAKTKTKTPKEPPRIPNLDEVLEYFQRMDAPTRLQDWEGSARLFFDTYNADGWINKYGRRVANWESEANKWMYYREQTEKQSQTNKPTTHNEQSNTIRPSAPSGGIPIRGKVTPSCGLKRRDK